MTRIFPVLLLASILALSACAPGNIPKARDVSIPTPTDADARPKAVNEKPDSVLYLPLGGDVLIPEVTPTDALPTKPIGPFELRGETLAGALQLILADYNVPLAFQTDDGLSRRVTVSNLRGPLDKVVSHVCGLANLYCDFEDGMLTVKDTQTFTVRVPPISQDTSFMDNVATGLAAIIGKAPIVDKSTRTIIYEATNRNSEMAERYFQRMRSNTALIVFETYIWEVSLNTGNSTGINWDSFASYGKFASAISVPGAVGTDFANPVSIGLPHVTGGAASATPKNIVSFLSTYGAVKTISQPQITVLSGSQAKLRAADKQNYVSKVAETLDNGQATTSVDTDSVDTGFTITIDSAWDNATVYASIALSITDVASIENFAFSTGAGTNGGSTTVQLPKTTEREVNTQVRIRPGDSLLIAGLVREGDNYNSSGPGVTARPILPTSRTTTAANLELVIMLRPRVIVFTSPDEEDYYKNGKNSQAAQAPKKDLTFTYDYAPLTQGDADKSAKMGKVTTISGKHKKVRIIPANTGPDGGLPQNDAAKSAGPTPAPPAALPANASVAPPPPVAAEPVDNAPPSSSTVTSSTVTSSTVTATGTPSSQAPKTPASLPVKKRPSPPPTEPTDAPMSLLPSDNEPAPGQARSSAAKPNILSDGNNPEGDPSSADLLNPGSISKPP